MENQFTEEEIQREKFFWEFLDKANRELLVKKSDPEHRKQATCGVKEIRAWLHISLCFRD